MSPSAGWPASAPANSSSSRWSIPVSLSAFGASSSVSGWRQAGHRLAATGIGGIADLITTFNTMLDRLEAERATSAARALSAQEAERLEDTSSAGGP